MSVTEEIEKKLRDQFSPNRLEIQNVSHLHKGHSGSPNSGDSHFEIVIVSDVFEGKSLVETHRLIYGCLDALMKSTIHALKIQASSR